MLKPAILGLIRQILTVAGTALMAKGSVQVSDIEPVIAALLTSGSLVWSVAGKVGPAAAGRSLHTFILSTAVRALIILPSMAAIYGSRRWSWSFA
jgi:hypothetical protein